MQGKRAETEVTKRLLRTVEMRILRAIAGHIISDHKRNNDIPEKKCAKQKMY